MSPWAPDSLHFSSEAFDFFQFLKNKYETAVSFLGSDGAFEHIKKAALSEYDVLLFGAGCMIAGILIATGVRGLFWNGRDKPSSNLKESSMASIKQIMEAIKAEYIHQSPSPESAPASKMAQLLKKKKGLEKQIEENRSIVIPTGVIPTGVMPPGVAPPDETGLNQTGPMEPSISEAESEIEQINRKIKKLPYSHKIAWQRDIQLAAILKRQTETVSIRLTGNLAYANFNGREAELGIQELNGCKHLIADHLLHKGRFHVKQSDDIDFELRFIPNPGTLIDVRERKLDGKKEVAVMKYKVKLTASLPIKFPKNIKRKSAATLKKINKKQPALTDASIHYIGKNSDRDKMLRSLKINPDQISALLRGKEKYEDFFFVENSSSKDRLFDSNLDIITMVSSERGSVRIDMQDSAGDVYYFETELYKPVLKLHKALSEFICPLF